MASITIRKLSERTKARLRIRAAQHRRSMEEEARNILRQALLDQPIVKSNLAEAIRARFAEFGDIELPTAARESMREPPRPRR